MDENVFKRAMSTFSTGVTVVTMKGPKDSYHGLTVSAFTAVSLDPPLVLFCRKNVDTGYKPLAAGDRVVINILSKEQTDLAFRFANPKLDNAERFKDMNYRLSHGVPILLGCKSVVESRVKDHFDGGDHTIFICEVIEAEVAADLEPLIYYNRDFYALLSSISVL